MTLSAQATTKLVGSPIDEPARSSPAFSDPFTSAMRPEGVTSERSVASGKSPIDVESPITAKMFRIPSA